MLAKNASPAGVDLGLGLGDQLNDQAQAEILARRKKGLAVANQPVAAYGALGMGSGLNNGSPAVHALLGAGGLGG